MRKNIKNIQVALFGVMLILSILSCKDKKWDMYDQKPEFLKDGSLYDLLIHKPEYSEFMGLVKKTGYDSVLKRSDLFTVMAVKNGAFASIDTSASTPELKTMIGMHILLSAIQQGNMNNNRYESVSGKFVDFLNTGTAITVNSIPISKEALKALNGFVYSIDNAIQPTKTLREIIASSPDFSMFSTYIDSSYTRAIDPAKNVIVGYDSKNQPIYQTPIIYRIGSTYMDTVKLDDEGTVSTLFLPTNQVVTAALTRLLTERANDNSLLVPKVDNSHRDTTIGYFFIPKNVPYAGDTAILLDYLFKTIVTRTRVPELIPGENKFTDVKGRQFSVNPSQTQPMGAAASNGIYYILNDITLPGPVYRKMFMFDPSLMSPTNPDQLIVNPNIVYSWGANTATSTFNAGGTILGTSFPYYQRGRIFNFTNVGGQIDYSLPILTSGDYRVVLQELPVNTGTFLNTSFGTTKLAQNINVSTQYTSGNKQSYVDIELGNIHQPVNGPATITFKCPALGPLTTSSWLFQMIHIRFIPI